jgi:hypothetical protein
VWAEIPHLIRNAIDHGLDDADENPTGEAKVRLGIDRRAGSTIGRGGRRSRRAEDLPGVP